MLVQGQTNEEIHTSTKVAVQLTLNCSEDKRSIIVCKIAISKETKTLDSYLSGRDTSSLATRVRQKSSVISKAEVLRKFVIPLVPPQRQRFPCPAERVW